MSGYSGYSGTSAYSGFTGMTGASAASAAECLLSFEEFDESVQVRCLQHSRIRASWVLAVGHSSTVEAVKGPVLTVTLLLSPRRTAGADLILTFPGPFLLNGPDCLPDSFPPTPCHVMLQDLPWLKRTRLRAQYRVRWVVTSSWFNNIFLLLIILNTVALAVVYDGMSSE